MAYWWSASDTFDARDLIAHEDVAQGVASLVANVDINSVRMFKACRKAVVVALGPSCSAVGCLELLDVA